MTDQTKCPHCGAEKDSHYTTPTRFDCGTIAWTQSVMQTQYCELRCLRAKVAAQQELLKEAAVSMRDLLTFIESSESRKELWRCCGEPQFAQEVMQKLDAQQDTVR